MDKILFRINNEQEYDIAFKVLSLLWYSYHSKDKHDLLRFKNLCLREKNILWDEDKDIMMTSDINDFMYEWWIEIPIIKEWDQIQFITWWATYTVTKIDYRSNNIEVYYKNNWWTKSTYGSFNYIKIAKAIIKESKQEDKSFEKTNEEVLETLWKEMHNALEENIYINNNKPMSKLETIKEKKVNEFIESNSTAIDSLLELFNNTIDNNDDVINWVREFTKKIEHLKDTLENAIENNDLKKLKLLLKWDSKIETYVKQFLDSKIESFIETKEEEFDLDKFFK